jgi:hypothetical protein
MPAKKRTVLFVTADTVWADILARRCADGEWKTRIALSVADAVAYKKRTLPAAVVVDLASLPEAREWVSVWKVESPSLPCAVCVQSLSRQDVSFLKKAGVDAIWLKGHLTARSVCTWLSISIVAPTSP